MLKAVASVRDEVLRQCPAEEISLEVISRVFTGLTIVDYIVYVRYSTPAANPIWGEFCRYTRRPSVYDSMETIVEVRYASHLSDEWRRYIVCKELCHALDVSEGCHVASSGAADNLVAQFSMRSHFQATDATYPPFQSEVLAEAAALELLCPLHIRKALIQAGIADHELAGRFSIPITAARRALSTEYNDAVQWFLENGR